MSDFGYAQLMNDHVRLQQRCVSIEARLAASERLLEEARDSVRNHWRKHMKGLERAIRTDRLDAIAIETRREAELRDLRDRIDAFLKEKPGRMVDSSPHHRFQVFAGVEAGQLSLAALDITERRIAAALKEDK